MLNYNKHFIWNLAVFKTIVYEYIKTIKLKKMRFFAITLFVTYFILSLVFCMAKPLQDYTIFGNNKSKLIFGPTEPAYHELHAGEIQMEVTVSTNPIYFRTRNKSSKLEEVQAN